MNPVLFAALLAAAVPQAPKETPPPAAAPRRVMLPTPVERRLTNGLRVIVISRRGTGLLSVVLTEAGAGAGADPNAKAGLASFTAALLTRGTPTRSATQVAREIESLGGTLSAGAGWDSAAVNLSVLRANREAAVGLMADVALHPAFAPDEVARLRTETQDDLKVSLEEPGTLARYAAARVVFGASPYGHPLGGTPESLPQLSRADAAAFYQTHFSPAHAALIFGGDIAPDEAFALADKAFGGWRNPADGERKSAAKADPAPPLAGKIVVIDKPDAGQAAVIVTRRALARRDPDYYAVAVADDVLGGGYSSRLNREVRVKRGLAYGAGSSIAGRRSVGPFVASSQTKNESAAEVAELLLTEMRRLATAVPSNAELTTRKAALSGEYARALESGGGLTGQVAALAALDVPLAELSGYLPGVQRVSASDVRRAAAAHLSPVGASIVIVGDARRFLPDLRRRFKGQGIVVIPVAAVDFNRATLTKKPR